MNKKEIRQILIDFIEKHYEKYRIFLKKEISSFVCDLMLVSNKLIGFKFDDESSFGESTSAFSKGYDEAFSKVYVVTTNMTYSKNHIPPNWGIMLIEGNEAKIYKKAVENEQLSPKIQLSTLWKLELKTLAENNRLSYPSSSDKSTLINLLLKNVSNNELLAQIAQVLFDRDYSIFDAEDYSIKSGSKDNKEIKNETQILQINMLDNISDSNFNELTPEKWMEIYNQAKSMQEKREKIEKEKAEERKKILSQYQGVRVSLGAPWISCEIINDFVNELLNIKDSWVNNDLVNYEPLTGKWSVWKIKSLNSLNEHKYGTPRYPALRIIEATLNLREIIVADDGEFNEAETIAANEKQKLIIQEFENWVWKDDYRKWKIIEEYHKIFGDIHIEKGEDIELSLKGINTDIELYDYQKSAIQRIIANKNTLLAFEVGTGKTYIMIAAAMEMREKGISKKNIFVVPNNIVGQWHNMFKNLYPNAKLLVVEPKSFVPTFRKQVLLDIQNNDYDGIIIAYSCFDMIGLSQEFLVQQLTVKLENAKSALSSTSESGGYHALKNEIDRLKKNISEIENRKLPKDLPTFDQLGVNSLFVDEAHNFKNIPIETNLANIRGINPIGSTKCLTMLQKVRAVQHQNNGRGVIFATGTPLSNSIADAYTMQNYLQIERLEKNRLDIFDNWVKTFAKPEQVFEVDVNSTNLRFTRKFAKFFNLPELSKMFSEIAIFHSNTDMNLPEFNEYTDIQIKPCEQFKYYMDKISRRVDLIRAGKVSPVKDNLLVISTDGRKSALDLELVKMKQPYNHTSKVYNCVQNVYKIYNENKECSQIIFCDYSTPKGDGFSIYQKLFDKLVDMGVNAKEIAFIHNAKSEQAKQKLFEDVNNGNIRILIGSTCKLGIGANVQTRLKAIHHIDVPWRPADMVQREGRILRQGNTNKEIFIFRYILEGSFDAYCWQILETKITFINQFLSNASLEREISDLEENVLSYAEVKALALAEPLMKQIMEKENEIKNAKIVLLKNTESKEILKGKLERNKKKIDNLAIHIENSIKIGEKIKNFDEKEIKNIISENLNSLNYSKMMLEPGEELFEIYDFKIISPTNFEDKRTYLKIKNQDEYFEIEVGDNANTTARRILHFFTKFNEYLEKQQTILENLKADQVQQEKDYQEIDLSDINIKKLQFEKEQLINQSMFGIFNS